MPTATIANIPQRPENFRFDWFSVTVHGLNIQTILEAVMDGAFPQATIRQAGGRLGYSSRCEVVSQDGQHTFCSLNYEGTSTMGVFVESSGEDSGSLIAAMRELRTASSSDVRFHVKRVDGCVDFRVDDQGDWFKKQIRKIEGWRLARRGQKLKHVWHGEFPDSRSRTVAIGSRTQPVFVRFYEKGWQMEPDNCSDPFWTRLEVEYKPKGAEKRAQAMDLSAYDLFSLGFAYDLGIAVFNLENLGRYTISGTRKRKSSFTKFENMLNQYGGTFLEAFEEFDGDGNSFVQNIREMIGIRNVNRHRDGSSEMEALAAKLLADRGRGS